LTLGKYSGMRQPGLTWILIGIQRMIKVDLRIATMDIPQQEVITKDNVPVGINAVVYFKVEAADKAILNIQDYTFGRYRSMLRPRCAMSSAALSLTPCYPSAKRFLTRSRRLLILPPTTGVLTLPILKFRILNCRPI